MLTLQYNVMETFRYTKEKQLTQQQYCQIKI